MTTAPDIPVPGTPLFACYDLATVPYLLAQELQIHVRRAVAEGLTAGLLLLLEHPPVVTLGAHAPATDLVNPSLARRRAVDVVRSERGGRSTVHAPGQLIAYPILPIPGRDLRRYVHNLEEVLIHVLRETGLRAQRMQDRPGLYVEGKKIASLGLRCEHGIASHGSALNVDPDLSLFDLIVSCGEPSLRQTSVADAAGVLAPMAAFKASYTKAFQQVFGLSLAPLRPATCEHLRASLTQVAQP